MMSPRAFLLGGLGLLLITLIGLTISGDLGSWWWHAGTLATSLTIPLLLRDVSGHVKKVIRAVFISVTLLALVALINLYLAEYFGVFSTKTLHAWLNKNVLISGLVFNAFFAAVLAPKLTFIFISLAFVLPFISMARTPLIAVAVSTVAGVLLGVFFRLGKLKRLWQVLIPTVIIGIIASPFVVTRVYEDIFRPKNLLLATNDFSAARWNHGNAAFVEVIQELEIEPPGEGGIVQTLRLVRDTSHPDGASPLYQRGQESVLGKNYTASVWLRSDEEMKIIISSNLNWVVCPITAQWARCVVPAAEGDGITRAQFLFQFLDGQEDLTFQAWGPQLEIGSIPTEVQHHSADDKDFVRENRFLNRLNIGAWTSDATFQSRLALWNVSLQGIAEKPLAGHGLFQYAAYFAAAEPDLQPEAHSHNLVLEVLFERGVIGVIVLLGQFVLIVSYLKPARRELALVIIFVLLLEAANFQFYSTLIYYPLWIGLSLLPNRRTKHASIR